MTRSNPTILFLALLTWLIVAATVASAETVTVDARLSSPFDTAAADRHLQLVEGAAMEPFFDAGFIVFDSPATEADRLGAQAVLIVVLDLLMSDDRLIPAKVTYELRAKGVSVSGAVLASSIDDEASLDEHSIRLGRSAAERAISAWKGM